MRPGPMQASDPSRRNAAEVVSLDLEEAEGELVPVDTGPVVPAPPAAIGSEFIEQWYSFWASPMARAVHVSDLPALRQLFELRHLAAESQQDCDAAPMVEGSKGQEVINPRCTQAANLRKELLALEDRFGLNPQARLRLIGHDQENALKKAQRGRIEGSGQEATPRADPRLADPTPASAD